MMRKFILALLTLVFLTNLSLPADASSGIGEFTAQAPNVISETAVLMVAETGQVLYQKDMDKRMYPASITKIMTGMLALQKGDMSDMITMSDDAVDMVEKDSANIALDYGEQITLEQALYAISIASANDAANGIAEAVGGTREDFIRMMNEAAEESGAANTHFNNANGLPDVDHYTTAHDMALITAEALRTPGFTEIFGAKRYQIPPTNKQPETRIINSSNRFLDGDMPYDGMLISKAGWTEEAQHTLVTAARRNDITLVAVVMKAADSKAKWSDTTALLDYGFDQFKPVTISKTDIINSAPDDVTIPGHPELQIDPNTYKAQDVLVLLPTDMPPEDIRYSYESPQLDGDGVRVTVPVSLSLPADRAATAPDVLLKTDVKASSQPAPVPDSNEKDTKISVWSIILIVFLSIIGLLLLAFVFLVIRRAIIVRRRRKRKQQRSRQAAAQRTR